MAMPDIVDEYQARIEAWTDLLLAPSIEDRQRRRTRIRKDPKEFNDPVWGTLLLEPCEVALLDTPLLQRLRSIRQLGVVHLIYPAANHTRLEHSLGTVEQISRLVDSLNAHAEGTVISSELKRLLRLTALCHDVGHGAMSHVSQNAFNLLADGTRLKKQFIARYQQTDTASLSEIAAYFIIGSPAFATLLDLLLNDHRKYILPEDCISKMQSAIVGMPISNEIPLLHELVSGPFDADKLDYMTRDAYMTGVPVVTDVVRLVQKVRAVRESLSELPEELARYVTEGPASFVVTGVALSGARTLDELMLGRVLLFDKVYRHHKVRAAEEMVGRLLRSLESIAPSKGLLVPLYLADDELLRLDQAAVESFADDEVPGVDLKRTAQSVARLSADLRDRRLWVRAFAFAQNMPLDPYRHDDTHVSHVTRLLASLRDPVKRGTLTAQIAQEVAVVLAQIPGEDTPELTAPDIEGLLAIDPPVQTPEPNDLAYLVADGRRIVRFRDEFAETAGWVNAYHLTRDIGYVFASAEIAPYVYLATESLVRRNFGARIPQFMQSYARQDTDLIARLKLALKNSGYYDSAPIDLLPLPQVFTQGDFRQRISNVVGCLEGYSGPVRQEETLGKATLRHPERVVRWIQQFRDDESIMEALKLVERVELIGRSAINRAVREFLNGVGAAFARGGILSVLGSPKDSAAIVANYALDTGNELGLTLLGLSDAVRVGRPILFIDDFTGTGAQAVTIIESMVGVELTHELHEERPRLLSAADADLFRQRDLAFIFAAGSRVAKEAIQRRLQELGVQGQVFVANLDPPQAFQGPEGLSDPFRERCTEIGLDLLDDGDPAHDSAWREQRALGYGNSAYLTIFEYNTPAQTLTCLWSDGTYQGREWLPLFPRRKKR